MKDCGRVPAELVVRFKAATGRQTSGGSQYALLVSSLAACSHAELSALWSHANGIMHIIHIRRRWPLFQVSCHPRVFMSPRQSMSAVAIIDIICLSGGNVRYLALGRLFHLC